ncbi:MAG: hypothetical protein A2252_05065 [Elusimicrobia bacterium RIFOXYA2_FULL_39_19]|nr:MAG: hypothetical protein A2252_05065 [Elusimicrobia bacterium RIFOXYA2_FULL_39_19]
MSILKYFHVFMWSFILFAMTIDYLHAIKIKSKSRYYYKDYYMNLFFTLLSLQLLYIERFITNSIVSYVLIIIGLIIGVIFVIVSSKVRFKKTIFNYLFFSITIFLLFPCQIVLLAIKIIKP